MQGAKDRRVDEGQPQLSGFCLRSEILASRGVLLRACCRCVGLAHPSMPLLHPSSRPSAIHTLVSPLTLVHCSNSQIRLSRDTSYEGGRRLTLKGFVGLRADPPIPIFLLISLSKPLPLKASSSLHPLSRHGSAVLAPCRCPPSRTHTHTHTPSDSTSCQTPSPAQAPRSRARPHPPRPASTHPGRPPTPTPRRRGTATRRSTTRRPSSTLPTRPSSRPCRRSCTRPTPSRPRLASRSSSSSSRRARRRPRLQRRRRRRPSSLTGGRRTSSRSR